MSSNKRKSETLGMPFGTACGRLRKNILFSLLIRLGENTCFKCANVIDNVAELSIEHKEPWEGRDANLFWSLGNIAFSHLRCNRPHIHGNKKYTPEQARDVKRQRTARYMRNAYTTEKRYEKLQRTGH